MDAVFLNSLKEDKQKDDQALGEPPRPEELSELFGDNKELALFFCLWLKHGRIAAKAYKELHPEVTEGSARTLGSRMLTKINISTVLSAYGIDLGLYLQILFDGLHAKGQGGYDYKTIRNYHQVLGELLGLEKQGKEKKQVIPVGYIPPSWFHPPKPL